MPASGMTRDDVARAAGVSVATVSYVLNEGPRGVSAEKRRRVLEAVAALGYRPNAIARSLRARRTNILGLVLPNSASPYFAALAHTIEEAAAARGYQVVVSNAADRPEREAALIEALLRLRVDGLVWIPADRTERTTAGRIVPPDVPAVQVDRALPEGAGAYDVVMSDNAGGGRLAADHLVALGHRRVAILSGRREHRHAQERLAGARDRLAGAGIDVPSRLIAFTDFSYAAGARAAARWCALPAAERPTAIIAGNDRTAIGALYAAAEAGRRVPEDLSIVGFNDTPQAAFTVPPLTTIAQPLAAIGAAAVDRLLTRIESPDQALPPAVQQFPVRLVIRHSTSTPDR